MVPIHQYDSIAPASLSGVFWTSIREGEKGLLRSPTLSLLAFLLPALSLLVVRLSGYHFSAQIISNNSISCRLQKLSNVE